MNWFQIIKRVSVCKEMVSGLSSLGNLIGRAFNDWFQMIETVSSCKEMVSGFP